MYQNFIKIYPKVQETDRVSIFSEFEPRQNLDQSQMTARFDNHSVYIMSVVMWMQNVIKIYQKIRKIGPVSLVFRILTSAKPRPIQNDI